MLNEWWQQGKKLSVDTRTTFLSAGAFCSFLLLSSGKKNYLQAQDFSAPGDLTRLLSKQNVLIRNGVLAVALLDAQSAFFDTLT